MTDKQPEALELAEALEEMSTILDMGRKPDYRCKRRQAAALLRTQHAALERKDAQAVPPGYKLVPVETLDGWRQRVNTLAALSTKADRYKVGAELKQSIRDVMDAAHSTGETHD